MKNPRRMLVFGAAALLVLWADGGVGPLQLRSAAHAIIGRPLTPISYAGAARRTVRRRGRAYAYGYGYAAGVATATAVAAATRPVVPVVVPVGTIVTVLPAGCASAPIGGVNYFACGGVFYRPAFQSNNLVYVVSQP
jgi:hypothetical protein